VTITQIEIRFKTKVSHKHMVVIYHRNTPLPKVRKGLDRYTGTVFEDAPRGRVCVRVFIGMSVCALRVSLMYCVIRKKNRYQVGARPVLMSQAPISTKWRSPPVLKGGKI
jgi:hypothetical protein